MPIHLTQPFAPHHMPELVRSAWTTLAYHENESDRGFDFVVPEDVMFYSSLENPLAPMTGTPVDAAQVYYLPYPEVGDNGCTRSDSVPYGSAIWGDDLSQIEGVSPSAIAGDGIDMIRETHELLKQPADYLEDLALHGKIALRLSSDCLEAAEMKGVRERIIGVATFCVAATERLDDGWYQAGTYLGLGMSLLYVDQVGLSARSIAQNQHMQQGFTPAYIDAMKMCIENIDEMMSNVSIDPCSEQGIRVLRSGHALLAHPAFLSSVVLEPRENDTRTRAQINS